MLAGSQSGCINHPAVEAVARCKQCGRPVCGTCVVGGPTGNFCSDACKEKHQAFMSKAQQLEGRAGTSMFVLLRNLMAWVIIVVVVCVAVGIVATFVELPVVSELTDKVRGIIGI